MDRDDRLELLRRAVKEHGQAAVARAIEKSPSAISQILHGKYQGAPDAILALVFEAFGNETVACPLLGELPLAKCSENRRAKFVMSNPQRVRLYRACKTCPHNPAARAPSTSCAAVDPDDPT